MKLSHVVTGIAVAGGIAAFAFADARSEANPAASPAATHILGAIDSLQSPTGPGAAEPNLAVGRKGEVFLSWLEPVDSGYALRMSALTKNRWSTPVTIRSGRDFWVNWADFPSLAVLNDGRLAAHWLQRTGTGTYDYAVRIAQSNDNGRTWGTPVTPHRDSVPGEHGFVAMWPTKEGLGAVWLDSRKSHSQGHGEMMLMSTTVSRTGALGREVPVDARTCDCCQNAVAMTSTGPIIAYRDRTSDEIRDIYVTRLVNGKWTEGVPVHADRWKINACPVNGPAIEASGRNVVIAWFTGARDTNRVNVAFSTDGGATFGAPVRIDGGQPGGRVDLVRLPDGSAIASWLERTGGEGAAIRARRITPSGTMSEPRTIATSTAARASGVPRMVLNGTDLYFAWTVSTKPSSVRIAHASASDFK